MRDSDLRVSLLFASLRVSGYMNSLLQQFFMVPTFRFGILQAMPTKLAALQAAGPSAELTDHLLFQLQNLFGFLTASHKQFVDTSAFCRSYKDEFGQPINPRVQQDANEAYNVLLDRLEFALKTDPQYSGLIAALFEGKLVNQMICHGPCHTVRETTESFMTLSLEVKGKLRMEESLRAYVEGEEMSGINCAACGTKTNDTTKRECASGSCHTRCFCSLRSALIRCAPALRTMRSHSTQSGERSTYRPQARWSPMPAASPLRGVRVPPW